MKYSIKSKLVGVEVVVEADDKIEAINKAARQFFGLKESEKVHDIMITSFEVIEIAE